MSNTPFPGTSGADRLRAHAQSSRTRGPRPTPAPEPYRDDDFDQEPFSLLEVSHINAREKDEMHFTRPMTWAEFPRFLRVRGRESPKKSAVPLWSAGIWKSEEIWIRKPSTSEKKGGYRYAKNVVGSAPMLVYDIDQCSPEELEALLESLEPYEHVIYNSWSHDPSRDPPKIKLRVVIRLSHRVPFDSYADLWKHVYRTLLRGVPDPQTNFPHALFYHWSWPAARTGDAIFIHEEGFPLDSSAFASSSPPAATAPEEEDLNPTGENPTRGDLEVLANRLQSQTASESFQRVGGQLSLALRGGHFASVREGRHEAIVQMSHRIAENFPNLDAPRLVHDVFSAAINTCNTMEPEERQVTEEEWVDALCHAQAEHLAKHNRDQSILDALKTPEPEPVIVVYSDKYYVWQPAEQRWGGPVSSASLAEFVELSWQGDPELTPYKPKADGSGHRFMTKRELVTTYGAFADQVVCEVGAQRGGYWEARTRTFVEAAASPRELKPQYNGAIAEWLRLFAGDAESHEKLLDWLAMAPNLKRPLVALYLAGRGGTGKSLLVEGVSRIWSDGGATPFKYAVGASFNDAVLRCPFAFADEHTRGDVYNSGTGEIRDFIAARNTILQRKYLPTATLRGCLRLAFAANNLTMLRTREQLTRQDMAAVAERFLLLEPPQAARDYLENLPPDLINEVWIKQDGIAKHALWLEQNHIYERQGRFGIETNPTKLLNAMTASGDTGLVCTWVIQCLQKSPVLSSGVFLVDKEAKDGPKLYVSAGAVSESWPVKMKNAPPLVSAKIGAALRTLSVDGNARQHRVSPGLTGKEDNRVFAFELDIDRIAEYAEENGILDVAAVHALVGGFKQHSASVRSLGKGAA